MEPKYLGKQTEGPVKELDFWDWPADLPAPEISFRADEFTHLCPVTGQPDFGSLEIRYVPDRKCIETKSLKLYLMGFRDVKSFDERLVVQMATDIFEQLKPRMLSVVGKFKSRGGISVEAAVELSE